MPNVARMFASRADVGAAFQCGIRVVDGSVTGEARHWRYRRSVAAPVRPDGLILLRHGHDVVLHLRVEPGTQRHWLRPGYTLLCATEAVSGARLRVSCRPEAAQRLQPEPAQT